MSKDVERVASLGVDDWKTMDLMVDQHLHSVIETRGGGRGRERERERGGRGRGQEMD